MMRMRVSVAALVVAFLSLAFAVPFTARASENGRRNTTYALGALTGVLAYKHKWVPAAIAGVGTGIAYHNWQAQVDARHRKERRLAMRHSYRLGYHRGYSSRVARAHRLALARRHHTHHRSY